MCQFVRLFDTRRRVEYESTGCYLEEDNLSLADYSLEDIELANEMRCHSLGYLLQRDKRLERALAESPWLVQWDSNGALMTHLYWKRSPVHQNCESISQLIKTNSYL